MLPWHPVLTVPLRIFWCAGLLTWCLADALALCCRATAVSATALAHAVLPECFTALALLLAARAALAAHVRRRRRRFGIALRPDAARPPQPRCGEAALPALPLDAQRLVFSFVPPSNDQPSKAGPGLATQAQQGFLKLLACGLGLALPPLCAWSAQRHQAPPHRLSAQRLRTAAEIAWAREPWVPEAKDGATVYMLGLASLVVVGGVLCKPQS